MHAERLKPLAHSPQAHLLLLQLLLLIVLRLVGLGRRRRRRARRRLTPTRPSAGASRACNLSRVGVVVPRLLRIGLLGWVRIVTVRPSVVSRVALVPRGSWRGRRRYVAGVFRGERGLLCDPV